MVVLLLPFMISLVVVLVIVCLRCFILDTLSFFIQLYSHAFVQVYQFLVAFPWSEKRASSIFAFLQLES